MRKTILIHYPLILKKNLYKDFDNLDTGFCHPVSCFFALFFASEKTVFKQIVSILHPIFPPENDALRRQNHHEVLLIFGIRLLQFGRITIPESGRKYTVIRPVLDTEKRWEKGMILHIKECSKYVHVLKITHEFEQGGLRGKNLTKRMDI